MERTHGAFSGWFPPLGKINQGANIKLSFIPPRGEAINFRMA